MINKEEILGLSDGKEYYVVDSVMYENLNYVMICEIDAVSEEIVGMGKIMVNDTTTNDLVKVTDPQLLVKLAVEFGNRGEAFDFE